MNQSLFSVSRVLVGAALALALVAPTFAQQTKPAAKPVVIEGIGALEAVRVTASVEAVDLKNRIVTLKGPRGNVFAVPVGTEVKNLAQVKVGNTGGARLLRIGRDRGQEG